MALCAGTSRTVCSMQHITLPAAAAAQLDLAGVMLLNLAAMSSSLTPVCVSLPCRGWSSPGVQTGARHRQGAGHRSTSAAGGAGCHHHCRSRNSCHIPDAASLAWRHVGTRHEARCGAASLARHIYACCLQHMHDTAAQQDTPPQCLAHPAVRHCLMQPSQARAQPQL